MKEVKILTLLFFVFLYLTNCRNANYQKEAHKQPPNIVLIIADDVSWNDIGTYGTKEVMVRTKDFMYVLNERPSLSNPPPSEVIKSPL